MDAASESEWQTVRVRGALGGEGVLFWESEEGEKRGWSAEEQEKG